MKNKDINYHITKAEIIDLKLSTTDMLSCVEINDYKGVERDLDTLIEDAVHLKDYLNETPKESTNKELDKIIAEVYIKRNEYFIYFSKSEKPIYLSIRQDINRHNGDDDDKVISDYIQDNYGAIYYDIYPLFTEDKTIL